MGWTMDTVDICTEEGLVIDLSIYNKKAMPIDDDQNEIGGVQPALPLEGAPVNQPTEGGTE